MPALSKKGSPLTSEASRKPHPNVVASVPSFRAPRTSTKISYTPAPTPVGVVPKPSVTSEETPTRRPDPKVSSTGFVPASQQSDIIAPSPTSTNASVNTVTTAHGHSVSVTNGHFLHPSIRHLSKTSTVSTDESLVGSHNVKRGAPNEEDDILICSSQQDATDNANTLPPQLSPKSSSRPTSVAASGPRVGTSTKLHFPSSSAKTITDQQDQILSIPALSPVPVGVSTSADPTPSPNPTVVPPPQQYTNPANTSSTSVAAKRTLLSFANQNNTGQSISIPTHSPPQPAAIPAAEQHSEVPVEKNADIDEDDNSLPRPAEELVSDADINAYLTGGFAFSPPPFISNSSATVPDAPQPATISVGPKRTLLSFGTSPAPNITLPTNEMTHNALPGVSAINVAAKSPFRSKPKATFLASNITVTPSAPPPQDLSPNHMPNVGNGLISPLPATTSPETSNGSKPKRTLLSFGNNRNESPVPATSEAKIETVPQLQQPTVVQPSPVMPIVPPQSTVNPAVSPTTLVPPSSYGTPTEPKPSSQQLFPSSNPSGKPRPVFQTKPSTSPAIYTAPPLPGSTLAPTSIGASGRSITMTPSAAGAANPIGPQPSRAQGFYGLPDVAGSLYASRGVKKPYEWQEHVLNRQDVMEGSNFVYSLPTSGGKTFVAEVLLMRALLKAMKGVPGQQSASQQCSCLFVLPFVSLAEEKCHALQQFADLLKFNVEGYYGVQGRFPAATVPSIFVCTIEKANSLFNHLCDEGRHKHVKCVVVDELHMVGEQRRGPILELLLTKIRLASPNAQIVGMSATVPNLKQIADWLGAECYIGTFRPVPLKEHVVTNGTVLERSKEDPTQMINARQLSSPMDDHLQIMELLTEVPNCSTLVFCATRDQCFQYARQIVRSMERMNNRPRPECSNLLMDLKGLGPDAKQLTDLVPYGVAYHTGALSLEERDVVERGFKARQITILCCTSTLAAGVNLPARRVIFKTPYVAREFLTKSMYTQMCGRAGRAGFDVFGESFLLLSKKDYQQGMRLVMDTLSPVHSGLFSERHGLARALMESLNVGVFATTANAKVWTRALLANFTHQPIPERLLIEATQLVESSQLFKEERPQVPPSSPLVSGKKVGSNSSKKGTKVNKPDPASPNPRAHKRDREGVPQAATDAIVAPSSSSSLLADANSAEDILPQERVHTLASLSQHTPSKNRNHSSSPEDRDPIDTLIEGSIITLVNNGFLIVEALAPPPKPQSQQQGAASLGNEATSSPSVSRDVLGLYGMLGLVGGGQPMATNTDCPWAPQPSAPPVAPPPPSNSAPCPSGALNISQPSDIPVNQYKLVLTPFGKASVKACFGIEEALLVRAEMVSLQSAGIILTDDLQICYLVTPVMDPIECQWDCFNRAISNLSDVRIRIATSVGLDMAFVHQRSTVGNFFVSSSSLTNNTGGLGGAGGSSLATSIDGTNAATLISDPMQRKLYVCRRYFAALVLSDLLNEVSSTIIESRYNLNFSQQQGLLRASAIFSASMVAFCNTMEWFNIEALLAAFVRRLGFGVKPDIIPLMEINGVRASKARVLFAAGYRTPALIAAAAPQDLFKKVKESNSKDNKAAKFFTLRSAVVVIREANVVLQRQLREKKGELEEMALRAKGI